MFCLPGSNADEDAAHAFKVFDRDGDGLITAEELRLFYYFFFYLSVLLFLYCSVPIFFCNFLYYVPIFSVTFCTSVNILKYCFTVTFCTSE